MNDNGHSAPERPGFVPMHNNPPPAGFGAPGQRPTPARRGRFATAILPVLVAVSLTFVLTAGLFYSLYARGVLAPIFAQSAADPERQGLGAGLQLESDALSPDAQAAAAKLAAALKALDENYYTELSDAELLEALSIGLASGVGNRYTYYLSREDLAAMNEAMSGSYAGIGATVTRNRAGYNEILEVNPGGPADLAGVRAGDIPIEVDGEDVQGLQDVGELAARVKGPEGTTVEIVFFRPSEQRQITFTIERKLIQTEAVQTRMLSDEIGYLRISSFIERRALLPQFIEGMEGLVADGAQHIVFDLRNNPGGDASAVISCLDYLLPEGEIARTRGRSNGQPQEEVWSSDDKMFVPESMTYAILINQHSASASELFAGCLRDWEKATLIGETSYGKGSGTRYFEMPDGSAINVTVFRYFLPKGEGVEGDGLKPDIEITLSEEAQLKHLSQLSAEEDEQLRTAIAFLEGTLTPTPSPSESQSTSGDGTTTP